MTQHLWALAVTVVTSICVTGAVAVGWAMGRLDRIDRTRAQRAEDKRIRNAVDYLDPETLDPLPYDQDAPVRRRAHRQGTR